MGFAALGAAPAIRTKREVNRVARRKTVKKTKSKSAKTARRTNWLKRSKKDQARLTREVVAVFFFIFGLMSLVVMYKTEAEVGYGLRQFLVGTFGVGGWLVSIVCFYIAGILLLPAKPMQKTSRIAWATLLVVATLGVFELPLASDPAYTFSAAETRGGIFGFVFDRVLMSFLGPFLTGVVAIAGVVVSLMFLGNLSISQVAIQMRRFGDWMREMAAEGWYQLRLRLDRDDIDPEVIRHAHSRAEAEILADEPDPAALETDPEPEVEVNDFNDFAYRETAIKPVPDTPDVISPLLVNHADIEDKDSGTPEKPHIKQPSIWFLPPLNLLESAKQPQADNGDPKKRAKVIEETLASFGVEAKVVEINAGPTITQYALEPAVGVKVSKITALHSDLALALATAQLRIEAPIPGKPYVGIEVPNFVSATVTLRGMLQTNHFQDGKHKLPFALGRDVSGEPVMADLARLPHLLIAGATGSGKSVAINTIICSFLYKYNPTQLKLILVDPKVVELSRYNGIPHLLSKVITKPDKTLSALKWAINEMEKRYQILAHNGVRDIDSYNKRRDELTKMPYIVIIIDELADLMMTSPVEVEEAICRIAQKARAVGIHLILATQRPSVNVVTGLIKANVPGRMCFAVSSQIDSRVVLDMNGAEKLLGRGDMLYHSAENGKLIRLQGVFVSDAEVESVVQFWSKQGDPHYIEAVTTQEVNLGGGANDDGDDDELLADALAEIVREGRGSASLLQRRLRVGYARAARLIDILESKGVLGPADGSKPREILRHSLPGKPREDAAGGAPPQSRPTEPSPSESLFDEYGV
jgi:S-DNA-T family DNA segregation ATPase FtsK/SpoIIIE